MNKTTRTKKETSKKINIDKKELAILIGDTVSSCYGVVGLTNIKNLKSTISSLILKRENYQDGVEIIEIGSKISIDVHIVLAYGLKITEIINEIYKRLSYLLNKQYGDYFKNINIYVEDLKVL